METKLTRKIVVNGKEYASTDEMPPEIRALYEKAMEAFADRDGNQVPDFLEGKGPGVWQSAKEIWSVAREAQKLGISNVTFAGEPPAAETKRTTAATAPRAEAPRTEAPTSFAIPTTTSPLEPTATGGGGARSFFVLIALLGGALFIARQLGWF